MIKSVERLHSTGAAMRQALHSQDWVAISELDVQCRQAVEEAMLDAANDESELRVRMQELLDLYRELVSACQEERQRLASEMVQINQSKQGAKLYQLFG